MIGNFRRDSRNAILAQNPEPMRKGRFAERHDVADNFAVSVLNLTRMLPGEVIELMNFVTDTGPTNEFEIGELLPADHYCRLQSRREFKLLPKHIWLSQP